MARPRTDPQERFWEKVDRRGEGDCWLWRAGQGSRGYGQFRIHPKKPCMTASRASWIFANGPIPDGLVVCHRCDNPLCVNPSHLFLATDSENIADRHQKGRSSAGTRHGMARLTEAKVAQIRARTKEGATQREVARQFGIGQSQVGRIVRGESWKKFNPEETT